MYSCIWQHTQRQALFLKVNIIERPANEVMETPWLLFITTESEVWLINHECGSLSSTLFDFSQERNPQRIVFWHLFFMFSSTEHSGFFRDVSWLAVSVITALYHIPLKQSRKEMWTHGCKCVALCLLTLTLSFSLSFSSLSFFLLSRSLSLSHAPCNLLSRPSQPILWKHRVQP